jgi:cysteinyl-tRNA synthetase
MLTVYNTLTKQKETFSPIEEGKIKMYVCGPTVYDYFHIGNARSFVNSDFIRKYLEFKGYDVTFAMNLTDVDDKIIKKANAEKVQAHEIAERYTKAFFEDIASLKIKPATLYPKATEHMADIISMVQRLIDNGFAYVSGGDVFYDISKFSGYGKLSGKNTDDLIEGARVEVNSAKKSPLDFALWKAVKPDEPSWESPWGNGRPGWHIECSAMSCKHLGETFDIHAGGNDLIFPHHENEIAQSEAASGRQFAHYWFHFGFLNINNEKMSKSLGNFFTVRDFLKTYNAETIRFFFAQTHYGAPLNFSDDGLDAAKKGLQKIDNLVERLKAALVNAPQTGGSEPDFSIPAFYEEFEKAMDEDFNTPKACGILFDFMKEANRSLDKNDSLSQQGLLAIKKFIEDTAVNIFGITSFDHKAAASPSRENDLIELLIATRIEAKKAKQYQLSDYIRDEMKKMGIILQDGKDATTYKIQ